MSARASRGVSSTAARAPAHMRLTAVNKAFLFALIHVSFKIGALVSPWSFYRMRCVQRPGLYLDRRSERTMYCDEPLAPQMRCGSALEEPQCLRAVAHQYVLGLLVVIEHHFVGFSPNARFLVTTKRRVRRISVGAIGPYQ